VADVTTLDVDPEFGYRVRHGRRSVKTSAPGPVLARQTNTAVSEHSGRAETRTWQLGWDAGTWAQRTLLERRWTETLAGSLTMTWTPPKGSSSISVRFVPGSLRIVQKGSGTYAMECRVEEVL
jgi:hypothetical protein